MLQPQRMTEFMDQRGEEKFAVAGARRSAQVAPDHDARLQNWNEPDRPGAGAANVLPGVGNQPRRNVVGEIDLNRGRGGSGARRNQPAVSHAEIGGGDVVPNLGSRAYLAHHRLIAIARTHNRGLVGDQNRHRFVY